jgi:hypothetical protein
VSGVSRLGGSQVPENSGRRNRQNTDQTGGNIIMGRIRRNEKVRIQPFLIRAEVFKSGSIFSELAQKILFGLMLIALAFFLVYSIYSAVNV